MIDLHLIVNGALISVCFVSALVYAVEHLLVRTLAKKIPIFRLTRPAAYVMGLGTFIALQVLWEFLRGYPLDPLHLIIGWLIIAACSGLTVRSLWAVNREELPQETWPGLGPKRLTNQAIAATENAIATLEVMARIEEEMQDLLREWENMVEMAKLQMILIRHLPHDMDPDAPMPVLRRQLMERLGFMREEEKGK